MQYTKLEDEQLKQSLLYNIEMINSLNKMALEFFNGVSSLQSAIVNNAVGDIIHKMRERGVYSDDIIRSTQDACGSMQKAVAEGKQLCEDLSRAAFHLANVFSEQCKANVDTLYKK